MDEFHINLMMISTLGERLRCRQRSRKEKEESSEEGEEKRRRFDKLHFSAEKYFEW